MNMLSNTQPLILMQIKELFAIKEDINKYFIYGYIEQIGLIFQRLKLIEIEYSIFLELINRDLNMIFLRFDAFFLAIFIHN